MTTITVDLPDHLATKIDAMRDRLPDLLSEALMLSASDNGTAAGSSLRYPVLEEMIDFLCSGPTLDQIIAFKVSDRAQERLAELLDKNREEGLSELENAELDAYEHVDYVISLLKARARLAARS
jgi:hypothetical protein